MGDGRGRWTAARPPAFQFPLVQQALLVNFHPSSLSVFLLGIELASHLPKMLASLVEINKLQCVRKVFGD